MAAYILSRIGQSVLAIIGITMIVFALTQLTGSPIDALLPDDATEQQIANFTEKWGLDEPLPVQYLTFLGNGLQGNFGESFKWRGRTALEMVLERLPATLQLAGAALVLSLAVAVPLGVLAAVKKGSTIDGAGKIFALLGQSLPSFWVAIVLMWVFGVHLKWLPTSGSGGLSHLVLPAIALAWFQAAAILRLTRSAMLEALDAEYIKLARIKGLSERSVIWKHALRNAAIVPVTYFGILVGAIFTGTIVMEVVFAWPGVGQLAIEAIRGRDYAVVQAVVVLFALVFILSNLLADVLYAFLDPRISQRSAK